MTIKCNTTVPLVEQEPRTTPEHMSSPSGGGVRVAQFLVFCLVFCRSLCILLDIRILIAPLVSSNSSWICSVSLEICRKHQIYKDGYWLLTCFQYELRSLCEHMGSPPSLVGSVRGINLFSCVCCLSSACVLCTQYGKFLRIVHSSLFLRFSLTFT
jgi:hypothetical protein